MQGSEGAPAARRGLFREVWSRKDSRTVVKKLLIVAVLGLSAFAVWRKVQADRAELNLWTEATTADD